MAAGFVSEYAQYPRLHPLDSRRTEAIDAGFAAAFEVGSAEAFEAWFASTEEATLPQFRRRAQLETPRALEDAIRLFGFRIHLARKRAHGVTLGSQRTDAIGESVCTLTVQTYCTNLSV